MCVFVAFIVVHTAMVIINDLPDLWTVMVLGHPERGSEDIVSEPGSTTGIVTIETTPPGRARVVIVGAGFAGLAAAKALADRPWHRAQVHVTLVDRHNHHTFTPFLYQVATALLEPTGAAHLVCSLIRKLENTEFRLGEVTSINVTRRQVETDRGPIPYDYLVPAAGANRVSRAARYLLRPFSARLPTEPRGHLSMHVALQ
jgi:glycine/D-amino acid oxidase-like deaminating enzyme